MTDPDWNMLLTVDSLIKINNIITSWTNIIFRNVNIKTHGFDKTYMDKDLIKDKLYQVIDQFSERKITTVKLQLILLNKIHPIYDRNGRIYKICSFVQRSSLCSNHTDNAYVFVKQVEVVESFTNVHKRKLPEKESK